MARPQRPARERRLHGKEAGTPSPRLSVELAGCGCRRDLRQRLPGGRPPRSSGRPGAHHRSAVDPGGRAHDRDSSSPSPAQGGCPLVKETKSCSAFPPVVSAVVPSDVASVVIDSRGRGRYRMAEWASRWPAYRRVRLGDAGDPVLKQVRLFGPATGHVETLVIRHSAAVAANHLLGPAESSGNRRMTLRASTSTRPSRCKSLQPATDGGVMPRRSAGVRRSSGPRRGGPVDRCQIVVGGDIERCFAGQPIVPCRGKFRHPAMPETGQGSAESGGFALGRCGEDHAAGARPRRAGQRAGQGRLEPQRFSVEPDGVS
jgi:hypothetical protein